MKPKKKYNRTTTAQRILHDRKHKLISQIRNTSEGQKVPHLHICPASHHDQIFSCGNTSCTMNEHPLCPECVASMASDLKYKITLGGYLKKVDKIFFNIS